MTNVIIFFLGFILAIIIGQIFKINPGFVAVAFGFVLTWILLGAKGTSTTFINLFPVSLFWSYGIPIIFYGFADANGTLRKLGQNIMYTFRNARWAVSLAVLVVAAIVGGSGAGTSNTFIVAPLAWSICIPAGIPYMLVPFALWCGSFIGSFWPWTSNSALHQGLISQYVKGVSVDAMSWRIGIYYALYAAIVFIIAFIALKGWKTREHGEVTEIHKPEPFDSKQKLTLAVIFILVALLLVPSVIKTFAPNLAVTKWMAANFTIPTTCAFGIVILCIAGAGKLNEVFAKNVNWNVIWTITGMAMYCGLATPLGVTTALGAWLKTMPTVVIGPAIVLTGAALSFVVSASAVLPLLYTMANVLATAAGVGPGAMVICIAMGVGLTSFSPFSVGGATALIGAPTDVAEKLVPKQIACAIGMMVFGIILAFLGVFNLGA